MSDYSPPRYLNRTSSLTVEKALQMKLTESLFLAALQTYNVFT